MALSTVGMDSSILDEAQWTRLFRLAREGGPFRHAIHSGFVVTAEAGTRTIHVSAGEASVGGVAVVSNDVEVRTLTANATSINRVDLIVLRLDWVNNSATIAVRENTSVVPSGGEVEGGTWDVPLARVTVRPGVTTLANGDVEVCKPLLAKQITYRGSAVAADTIGNGHAGKVVSTVTVPDPGWPYVLDVDGLMRVSGDAGYGRLEVLVNDVILAAGVSGGMTTTNGAQPVSARDTSAVRTGKTVVKMKVMPFSMNSGTLGWGAGAELNRLVVQQRPA